MIMIRAPTAIVRRRPKTSPNAEVATAPTKAPTDHARQSHNFVLAHMQHILSKRDTIVPIMV